MTSAGGIPSRPLAALTVLVLALHWLLFAAAPGQLRLSDRLGPRPLITRTIMISPAPAQEVQPPQPQAAQAQPQSPVPLVPKPADPPPMLAMAPPGAPQPPPEVPGAPSLPAELPAAAAPEPPGLGLRSGAPTVEMLTPERARQLGAIPVTFAIPGSVRLLYKVTAHLKNQDWFANGELLWRHDGRNYDARLEISALLMPSRTQRSTGRITSDGLEPKKFSDRSRSEEATHFEYHRHKIVFSSNRPDAPLLAGAQDRLSVMLQLGAMIAGDPRMFPEATTIEIQTASTREAETWLFTVQGEEELNLPGGVMKALKLIRNPRREFDQKVELWLAPPLDYAPVRLRLTHPNGDWVDQQWLSTDRG